MIHTGCFPKGVERSPDTKRRHDHGPWCGRGEKNQGQAQGRFRDFLARRAGKTGAGQVIAGAKTGHAAYR